MTVFSTVFVGVLVVAGLCFAMIGITDWAYHAYRRWRQWREVRRHGERRREELRLSRRDWR